MVIFICSPRFSNILGVMPFARWIFAQDSTNLTPNQPFLSSYFQRYFIDIYRILINYRYDTYNISISLIDVQHYRQSSLLHDHFLWNTHKRHSIAPEISFGSAPSHYLNWNLPIVNWNLSNELQLILNRNAKIFPSRKGPWTRHSGLHQRGQLTFLYWATPSHRFERYWEQIDGFVQERCNSSALAMELRLSCMTHRNYDVITWKIFPHYWPFVRGESTSDWWISVTQGQWCKAMMLL